MKTQREMLETMPEVKSTVECCGWAERLAPNTDKGEKE